MNAKGGPARPCRFEAIVPLPAYISQFVSNSTLERILNLPNSIFTDVSDAINNALGTRNENGPMQSTNPTIKIGRAHV